MVHINHNLFMEVQKSLDMKNFIFKSNTKSDLYKISTQLDLLLREQRMQRSDLQTIKRLLNREEPTAEDEGYDISKDSK